MNINRLFRLGTGCGIEIRGDVLRVAAVRSRRVGVDVLGYLEIAHFRERNTSEWGAEYRAFLESLQLAHLSARVALPRDEVIVRELVIPPVSKGELSTAVSYQVESLHPFSPDDIYYTFGPLRAVREETASLPLVVFIARRSKVNAYADLFETAGVAIESFTVTAASFFGAVRVRWDTPPIPFLVADFGADGLEVYGEGTSRPLLSTWFEAGQIPPSRALSLTGTDLRLGADQAAKFIKIGGAHENSNGEVAPPDSFELCRLEDLLPVPIKVPSSFHVADAATVYATGLDAACPQMGLSANLLPTERRKKNSRWMYLPTAVLTAACLLLTLGFSLRGWIQDGSYIRAIKTETSRLSLTVKQVDTLVVQAREGRIKYAALEALDSRTGSDLKIVSELSDLLPETVWLNSLEIDDEGIRLRGIANHAASLLGLVNGAINFTDAEFSGSIGSMKDGLEKFQMTAKRRLAQVGNEKIQE